MVDVKFGSGEYNPTPSHGLPAFINGEPTGYMCTECGHMQKDLDPIFDDICLVCLKNWALKQGVSRLLPTKEVLESTRALTPTIKMDNNQNTKSRGTATTVIIKINNR